jgi:hypothetical protein
MVKAVAEISLGVALFSLYDYLSKKEYGAFRKAVLSLLELFAIYRFFALTLYQPIGLDNFRRIVYIMLIVLLSFLNVTFLARRFGGGLSRAVGRLSLPMYLVHFFIAQLYFPLLGAFKSFLFSLVEDPMNLQDTALTWYNFFKNTGGYDQNFQPAGMTWKDMFLFIVLVMVVSLVIKLYIALVAAAYRTVKKVRAAKAANREADYVLHIYK